MLLIWGSCRNVGNAGFLGTDDNRKHINFFTPNADVLRVGRPTLNHRLTQCVPAVNAWCWEINLATDWVTKLWLGPWNVWPQWPCRGPTGVSCSTRGLQILWARGSVCDSSDTWRPGAALRPTVIPTLDCTVSCHQSATSADVNISLCNNTTEPNTLDIGKVTIVIILISHLHYVHTPPFLCWWHTVKKLAQETYTSFLHQIFVQFHASSADDTSNKNGRSWTKLITFSILSVDHSMGTHNFYLNNLNNF